MNSHARSAGQKSNLFAFSKKGIRMSRFVHPSRGVNEHSLNNILKLREWLTNYGDIFLMPDVD
ncbi:MAG TPA: hypothetical protein VMP68_31305 [Candidatus Eisenbacteria bacterium]|nr:hypothetical protein [Candidatus Eisenbacteria bacterium]